MTNSANGSEIRAFGAAADRFLEESNALFPQEASELGLKEYDAELGRNDAAVHRCFAKLLRTTLAAVERLSDHAFRGDDWLDRRGFLAMLRTGVLNHAELEVWRTNPQLHCDAAIQSIFGLVVRNTENLRHVRPAIESRLAKLPDFLAAGAACVRLPVPLWTRLAVKTCNGAEPFLSSLEKQLTAISDRPEKTAELFCGARSAFKNYAHTIANKSPGKVGGFAIGRDAFEYLMRERLGLPYSLVEAEAIGHSLIAKLRAELKTEAARFGRKSAVEIIESAATKWCPGNESLLGEYENSTRKMREAFAAADLLTLPRGEKLKIMRVPEFLLHQFPTAAYQQPGPFAKDQTGIFWVNDLGAQQADAAKRRAEVRQHFGLELTCAHEGYPGHHVQFVIQNEHRSKLRRLFSHSIFYEGWTLWCEKMCVDFKIYEAPHARLMQLSDALWRAHRIVIDCGLHSGKMTHASAARFLVEGVGFTRNRAECDVNWYSSAPTVPMSYLLGRLELEKLHAQLVVREGWSVKRFNDWILGFGAIPWSWIWQAQLNTPAPI
ncbi:MAG: hypothetical protein QOD99_300 [Chthoniobacter sp.]|jgi:hypothetical protein|nr:hypothetical protein [Chthoniobacter sp.]